MAGFGFDLRFWTLQTNNVSEKDISVHQYYGKDANRNGEYYDLKRSFVISRCETWNPKNKRPDKLRDAIKMLEEVLKSQEVIYLHWKSCDLLQVLFSSGLLASIIVSQSDDVSKLSLEKWFVGKVPDGACSGLYGDQFVCFAYDIQTKLVFSTLKPEYKMYNVDLPGPQAKIKRHLCMNSTEDLMICWWHFGPWMQTAREHERINLVLLRCSFGRLEVLASLETENEVIQVEFSKITSNRILTLEKSYNEKKKSQIDTVIYECTNNDIQRLNVISLPLKSGVLSYCRNRSEDKVVIGCSDGSLIIYDLTIQKMLARVDRASIVPTISLWLDSLILVGSGQGEIRMYDIVLNPILFFNKEENECSPLQLSNYLVSGNSLIKMIPSSSTSVTLLFNGGPIAMLNLFGTPTTLNIIQQHLYADKVSAAIQLLASINWNYDTEVVYRGLILIAEWLLQRQLDYYREEQLEATLATFYSAKHPISDEIIVKHRSAVGCYARKFFHHLLRFQRFEKAFLLAKDINSSDLFMDIYFAAKDLGEMHLAKVAKSKADEIKATDSSEDEHEKWAELGRSYISRLIATEDDDKYTLEDALRKEFATTEGGSSSLKVTNLGFV